MHRHRRRRRSSACERGEIPIYEPGPRGAGREAPRRACTSRPTSPTRSSTRGCCSSRSARRRPTPATPTCRAVHAVVDAMPPSDRHALVMKSTVPVGTGALDQAHLRRAGQGGLPLRLLPGVPQGGLGGRGLPEPRPRRRRRRRRLGRRRRRRALRAARRAARAHRHRQRRDGQARLQRLPGDEDLVHQRDRQRLRGDRRGRHRGRAGHGPRRPHRAEVPAGRHRLRRLVLSQGRRRAQAARRQLRLPLPAAQRR